MGQIAGCTKAMVLASTLVGTALLMALAPTSPAYSSLAWISFLPLFWAIRFQGPTTAAFLRRLLGDTPSLPVHRRRGAGHCLDALNLRTVT